MTPRQECQAAYVEALNAKDRVQKLLRFADPALLDEVRGWEQGELCLIGSKNTWRADPLQKGFDARGSDYRREVGEAISAWYFAMQRLESKWSGFRLAEPLATDLPNPESLTR